jgi:tetratricopeptide (TPR) repeat protein
MNVVTVEQARAGLAQLEHVYSTRPSQQIISNLAATYFTIGESERAIPFGQKAVELNPNDHGSWLNLGMMLKDVGDHEGSAEAVRKAYEMDKTHPYKRLAYAESLLRRGEWTPETWRLYDTSRLTKEGAAQSIDLPLDVKMWDGKEAVEELIVINEGGAGDRINYTRFLPELTRRGINWKFWPGNETSPGLCPFYERLPWIGDRLLKENDPITPSHWTTTFSLLANLAITPETVPAFETPYTTDPALVGKFELKSPDSLPVLGIAWSAAELWQGGRKIRSLTDFQAARLVCQTADKAHYVNLQPGYKAGYPVTNVNNYKTWQDTAAIIANCDGVVAVDTGTFWLSVAMGKPTALLLSSNSDFKFLEDGPCIWGKNVTIFRNGPGGGFEKAIDKFVASFRNGELFQQ